MANVAPAHSHLEPLLENSQFAPERSLPRTQSEPLRDSMGSNSAISKRVSKAEQALERSRASNAVLMEEQINQTESTLDKKAKEEWPTMNDKDALQNLEAYQAWMLDESSWIMDRTRVEEAFKIIKEDIPISIGPNGEVEDLVCGPALPYCYKCNIFTWSSFFIIYWIARVGVKRDQFGMALFPSGYCLAAIVLVFFSFTFLSIWFEFRAAMYVLPAQAISCGKDLVGKTKDQVWSFNQWVVGMLTISFLYHLDICTTAIFVARIVKSCDDCDELNHLWAMSMHKSILSKVPVVNILFGLRFKEFVECGMFVMVLQLIYALAFSYPLSPNLSIDNNAQNRREEDKAHSDRHVSAKEKRTWYDWYSSGFKSAKYLRYRWCDYQLASLEPDEILSHPMALLDKNKHVIGAPGDWEDRPAEDFKGKKSMLCDGNLVPVAETEEDDEVKYGRLQVYLRILLQKMNEDEEDTFIEKDTYQMRLARHRRARIAVFDSFIKTNMGYGRAVQALVESGRMNLMQWQDDAYLGQAEHAWGPWNMVNEIRRTNIRFFLFALQAAFIPNFQITFFGIVSSNNAERPDISADAQSEQDAARSNMLSAASTIICTIIGLKYLWYEAQTVWKHEAIASVAIDSHNRRAEKAFCQRRRWEGERLTKRANFSKYINILLVMIFSFLYVYLMVKVVMVMVVCDKDQRMYNVKWPPFTKDGCLAINKTSMCNCHYDTVLKDNVCDGRLPMYDLN